MNDKDNNQHKDDVLSDDITKLFDNFIKEGVVIKEEEVLPDLKIKLKVLSVGELLAAQSIIDESSGPVDIVSKVRGASILSQAILALNNMDIEKDSYSPKEIRIRRATLYTQILRMPSIAVQKMYELYLRAVEEQNQRYNNIGKMAEDIENF